LSYQSKETGEFKLIRSGGEIVFEEGSVPLSSRIPKLLHEKLISTDERSMFFNDSVNKWLIGKSEIGITSIGAEGCLFGGSFESADHKKGNTGESWYIINYHSLQTILEPINKTTLTILVTGLLLVILLVFAAFAFGRYAVKPINQLIERSKQIAATDFSTRIDINRKDEIGLLGKAFNKMVMELEQNTTSIKYLEYEITEREKSDKKILQQNKELQDLNATKDKFFSIIAHDLKSPLSSMLGLSEILYKDFDDCEIQQQKEFSSALHKGIKNTYKLLENLLIWSRSQQGSISFNPEKTNLYLLVNESCELLKQATIKKEIRISNQISKDAYVNVDKQMSLTIIRNLLSNAIKFTSKGGDITFNAQITSTKIDQKFLELSIQDSGVGISNDNQSRLFSMNSNTSTHGTAGEKGTGLGLIICKEFVEKQGGRIWIESEVDKGSKFIFTMPVAL
jgi:signal transduction histidine kinase